MFFYMYITVYIKNDYKLINFFYKNHELSLRNLVLIQS